MAKRKDNISKKQKWRIFRNKWRDTLKPVTDSNTFLVTFIGVGVLTETALSFGTSWGIITGAAVSGGLVAGGMQQDKKRQKKQITWTNKAGQEVTSSPVDKDIIEDMEMALKRQYFFSREVNQDSKFKSMFNEASQYCAQATIKIDGKEHSADQPYIFIRDYQNPVEEYRLVDEAGHPVNVKKPEEAQKPKIQKLKK